MNRTCFWSGFWICGTTDPAPYLRKSFKLQGVPKNAVMYLCGLGWHELYINRTKTDDRVRAPAISQFDKRVSSINYDITHLESWKECNCRSAREVEAEHVSPFGKISVSWKRESGKIYFRCEIPEGCTAELFANSRKQALSSGVHEVVFGIEGNLKTT